VNGRPTLLLALKSPKYGLGWPSYLDGFVNHKLVFAKLPRIGSVPRDAEEAAEPSRAESSRPLVKVVAKF